MELISRSVRIPVNQKRVLDAITTTEGFRAWWVRDCEVGRAAGEEAVFRMADIEVMFRIDRLDARGIEMTCLRSTNFPDWEGSHLTIRAIEDGSRSRRPRLSATRRCHAERPPGSACGRRGGESWRAGDRHGEHGRIFRPARRGGGQLPDEFLCNLFDLDPLAFVEMLREQAGDLIKPPVTFEELLERLARVVPEFVVAVRHLSPRP